MKHDTIPHRVLRNAKQRGDRSAIRYRDGDTWQTITWRQYADRALAFAGGVLSFEARPGSGVAIVSNNRAEWLLAAAGAMCARTVPTGIYQTLTPEGTAYVAAHCEASVIVVEDAAQWAKIDAERANLPDLRAVVMITGADQVDDPLVLSFDDFCERGAAYQDGVEARMAMIAPEDLGCLIYTSGTTGHPKGVMLSHQNLAWTGQAACELIGAGPDDHVVSYLPLSHIAEQLFSLHGHVSGAYTAWMCPRIDLLKDTLVEARPTLFLAVPRVWEKFKAALEGKLDGATGIKAAIVGWARSVGLDVGMKMFERGAAGGLDALRYRVADTLFFSKLKGQLGLDRLRIAVTGAAPISRAVLEFFVSCGVPIHEVYGQSEDTGPTTFNIPQPGQRKLGTVGVPFPGVEVRIAEDGEICVRGPNVFLGYYKNPEATAEALIDGWLHSGDIGQFEGPFLRITDRKKDLIITAGGKNVAPQNIEKPLRAIAGIGQAVVVGDRLKYLSALLTIDAEAGPAFAQSKGWPEDPTALAKHPDFIAHVAAGVEAANRSLAKYETIKRHTILPVDFSIEGGELTPTQKVKRKVVREKYAAEITAMYPQGEAQAAVE